MPFMRHTPLVFLILPITILLPKVKLATYLRCPVQAEECSQPVQNPDNLCTVVDDTPTTYWVNALPDTRYIVMPPPTEKGEADRGEEVIPMSNGHYIYRDARTGQLVTQAYAKAHPDHTVREWVPDK